MNSLKISIIIAVVVCLVWTAGIFIGSLVFNQPAADLLGWTLNQMVIRFHIWGTILLCAPFVICMGRGIHAYITNPFLNEIENRREEIARKLQIEINITQNERSKIETEIARQVKDRAQLIEDQIRLANENRQAKLDHFETELIHRKNELEKKEAKISAYKNDSYYAAQKVSELKKLNWDLWKKVNRAIQAMDEDNPSYAYKILAERKKKRTRRRSKNPQEI